MGSWRVSSGPLVHPLMAERTSQCNHTCHHTTGSQKCFSGAWVLPRSAVLTRSFIRQYISARPVGKQFTRYFTQTVDSGPRLLTDIIHLQEFNRTLEIQSSLSYHKRRNAFRTLHKQAFYSSGESAQQTVPSQMEAEINVSKILKMSGPLSRKMEKEKENDLKQKRGLQNIAHLLRYNVSTSGNPCWYHKDGRKYHDWRGCISVESLPFYSGVSKNLTLKTPCLCDKEAVQEITEKTSRGSPAKFLSYSILCDKTPNQQVAVPTEKHEFGRSKSMGMTKVKSNRLRHSNYIASAKLKRIGPHVEVYEAFHPVSREPSRKMLAWAAVYIQKYIRGWLVRRRLNRIRAKAANHGSTFEAVVKEYRKMMSRLQHRFGISKPSTQLSYSELEEWLDKKTMYENIFSKREFWKEMDKSELPGFFRDCGHYPNRQEIEDVWCLINQGSSGTRAEVLKRQHVVEIAFTLYPPKGANLSGRTTRQSTWVSPIVDGEEGYKYLVSNHPVLKEADIHVVGQLVATSIRERKERLESSKKVEPVDIDEAGISEYIT